MALLEIACFNPESTIAAATAGADRIELCANAAVGGTTPDTTWLAQLRGQIHVPINIMVRPRGGDFVYSDVEFQEMKESISNYKSTGADGFVFGILLSNGRVDVDRTRELVRRAHPLPCTFHRAFDETPDLLQALEDIISCGVKTVLTSGAGRTAVDGVDLLALLTKAAERRVTIMPGGGVRSSNIGHLLSNTKAGAFHSAALIGSEQVASVSEIGSMKEILASRHSLSQS